MPGRQPILTVQKVCCERVAILECLEVEDARTNDIN